MGQTMNNVFDMNLLETLSTIVMALILLVGFAVIEKRKTEDGKVMFYMNLEVLLFAAVSFAFIRASLVSPPVPLTFSVFRALLLATRETMAISILIHWLVFADYSIYKSKDTLIRRYKLTWVSRLIVFAVNLILGLMIEGLLTDRHIGVFTALQPFVLYGFGIYYVIRAVLMLREAKKERRAPSFIRAEMFFVPFIAGYVLSHFNILPGDWRSFFIVMGLFITWIIARKRYKYMDERTGFYKMDFFSTLSSYMEKTDFPNAVGILFTAKGHGEKLAVLLEQLRPDNSQILSADEERYLVLCPRLPDRVILRLTDKVKKMASMDKEPYEVESAYIIRKDGESLQDFNIRLQEMM